MLLGDPAAVGAQDPKVTGVLPRFLDRLSTRAFVPVKQIRSPRGHKLCLLVVIGCADGRMDLIALIDRVSRVDLLRDCKCRGMRPSVLAIGDGVLGFWGALRGGVPDTREQRCWFTNRHSRRSTPPSIGSICAA